MNPLYLSGISTGGPAFPERRAARFYKQALVAALVLLAGTGWAWAQSPAAVPYEWRAVAMGGGGFVDGIVFHPTAKDILYARTDVGGAYRWDSRDKHWVPLNDWLSAAQTSFTGIESIALDPSDPNRLYLAAGIYLSGPAAILRSDDQGRTFQIFETPFRMGGNTDGRSNGERLAVDPNDGAILFFGSRSDGLWKSVDRGTTWTRIGSFPAPMDQASPAPSRGPMSGRQGHFGDGPIGIVSVVFDGTSGRSGSPTPVLYAAVSTSGTNLFRSGDAGATWQAVAGQPAGLRPSHLIRGADGVLYLTYGSFAGPNNVREGEAWKYDPATVTWTNISPEKSLPQPLGWGYGAVAVDAEHPGTVMVSTIDRWALHDEVFRSTDGGATWHGILVNGQMDYSMAPYTKRLTPHWLGTLAINPRNPDQVLFGTGYGIWCSMNASRADTGGRVSWVFLDQGLEETVPQTLISPPAGAHLISGVGDIDGFVHDDVAMSPAAGTFVGVRFNNTRDLAFAAGKPGIMVRIGNGGRSAVHGAISSDGGVTWAPFGSDAPGGAGGQGRIAISADAGTIIWAPQRGSAFSSSDGGKTWTNCAEFAGRLIVADPVNPSRFYGFDAETGKLLTSMDRGATFTATAASFPNIEGYARGAAAFLAATTGTEGDLWAGSRSGGLYHSIDGGMSFTKLTEVNGAEALGFGKAGPGRKFPAIYLLGSINKVPARYRSDDIGKTWVRIDDDQHQFAMADVPVIIGDPRIYGRVYFTTGGRGVIYGDPIPKGK